MTLASSGLLIFVLGVAAAATAPAGSAAASPGISTPPTCPGALSPGVLRFPGLGQVFAAPDEAQVALLITAQAADAQDAREEAESVATHLYTLLQSTGFVKSEDIRTSSLTVSPLTQALGRNATFRYLNSLTVTVHNVTGQSLARVLDAAVAADDSGLISISGVTLRLSTGMAKQLADRARRMAVSNAMGKAKLYSEALEVRLGALLSFDEVSSTASAATASTPQDSSSTEARASTASPVALGQQVVQAVVQASFTVCSS